MQEVNPDLFIVDVDLTFVLLLSNGRIPVEEKKLKLHTTKLTIKEIPLLLLDGKIPTEKQKKKLFIKFHNKFKIKENIDRLKIIDIRIYNIKYSSKIQWRFDYEKD